jgi:hypothetical protein
MYLGSSKAREIAFRFLFYENTHGTEDGKCESYWTEAWIPELFLF